MLKRLIQRLALLSACAALGQEAPAQQVPPAWGAVPPEVFVTSQLYRALFKQVTMLQQMAMRLSTQGKDNKGPLHEVKRQAGLTDAEEATLTTIATTSNAAFEAGEKNASALVAQFMKENAQGTPMPVALHQQVEGQKAQDLQSILNGVQELQAAFGQARFQKLDNYVRTVVAKSTKTGSSVLKQGTPSHLPPGAPAQQ